MIYQDGKDNVASIDQNAFKFGFCLTPNIASIYQDGNYNEATIEQEGAGNKAIVDQSEDGSMAKVEQAGKDNLATVTQTGEYTYAYIDQEGKDNTATILQVGDKALTFQVLGQTITDPRDGADMIASIKQDGTDNTASITETAGGPNMHGVLVVPNYNRWGCLLGTDYYPYIIDNPEMPNVAMIDQEGAYNEATINICGEGNLVNIDQESPDCALKGNDALVTVNGELNTVCIDQEGVCNKATVMVGTCGEAELNLATIKQDGCGNTACVTQNNNAHW
ncbi:MAG: hypothetical protein Q8859_11445, partial [Bacteroidota bacterium]|nr:hypothetical protein [Bacteroidota bacterium]